MSKQKDKKKKDRERRVAAKKLADAAQRLAQEKAAKDTKQTVSRTRQVMTSMSAPKVDRVASAKRPFTHRRTGGG